MHLVSLRRLAAQLVAERHQRWMQAQLQHGVDAPSGFLLELLQAVEVPRVDDQRLLAEHVRADPQRNAHVGVVQVVGRADAQEVNALLFGPTLQLLEVPVEALELGEEADIERIAVEDADRIVRIDGGDQPVPGVVDRLEVARRDEPGDAGHCKVFCAHNLGWTAACSTAAICGAVTRSE